MHEEAAIHHFESVTKSTTSRCGYFSLSSDSRFGASPDATGPGTLLLEIKTHAEKSSGPLQKLSGEHVVQTQLQMACKGFDFTVVMSFHQETNSAIFF